MLLLKGGRLGVDAPSQLLRKAPCAIFRTFVAVIS